MSKLSVKVPDPMAPQTQTHSSFRLILFFSSHDLLYPMYL